MVEQNFRFAAPLADRFYVIEHGQIVETIERRRPGGTHAGAARAARRLTVREMTMDTLRRSPAGPDEPAAARPGQRLLLRDADASGLAVIFGLLNVINFAHGALYMLGAFLAWIGVTSFGLNYW